LFFGICAFTGAALGSFTLLAAMTVLARLFLYIISCAAVPKLRPQFKDESPFILKGGPIIPILGIAACVWLMFQVSFLNIWMTALFIAAGTGLYYLARWQRAS
jgi:amino acid transporter